MFGRWTYSFLEFDCKSVVGLCSFIYLFYAVYGAEMLAPSLPAQAIYCRCSRNIACHSAQKVKVVGRLVFAFKVACQRSNSCYQSTQVGRFSESAITGVTWLLYKSKHWFSFYILRAICSWNKRNNYWCINTCSLWQARNYSHQHLSAENNLK